jgi:predicted transcriptional regulator
MIFGLKYNFFFKCLKLSLVREDVNCIWHHHAKIAIVGLFTVEILSKYPIRRNSKEKKIRKNTIKK